MWWLLLIIICVIVALALVTSISTNVATAQQAQAAIEAARAAQMATAGQTVGTVGLTVAVIVLGLLVLGLVALIVRNDIRQRHPENGIVVRDPPGRWKSGPNAQWQRQEEQTALPLRMTGDPVQQMMQLQMLKMLQEMNQPKGETRDLVVKKKADDEDDYPVSW